MKTNVIKEAYAFSLQCSDYNVNSASTDVSFQNLRNAKVGDMFETHPEGGLCGRDVSDENAKVVFKDENGVLVLFREWGTTDSPNPTDWEKEPMLTWFEFV